MSKAKSVILILIAFPLVLSAQLSIGVRGGYGSHGVRFEPKTLNQYQVAYMRPDAGLVLIYNNFKNAGFQIEFNYAQKGWKERVLENSDSILFTRSINYFEVPFLTHAEFGKKSLRVLLIAGPYGAYKLGEKTESKNFDDVFAINVYDHYHQTIRDIDFGLRVGTGLRYNINSRLSVYGEFRYNFDIAGGQNIFKGEPNKIQSSRLKEIGAGFGIVWNIKKQEVKVVKDGYVPKEHIYEETEDGN